MKISQIVTVILFFLVLFATNNSLAQSLSGYILDKSNREPLISATMLDTISNRCYTSNKDGYFTISVNRNKLVLKIQFVGYKEEIIDLTVTCDTLITILLLKEEQQIEEVKITGFVPIHEQTLLGKTVVPVQQIEATPTLTGIPDLMHAITHIPGITTGSEARSTVFVRGGDVGQNLVLLDGAKLYGTTHLGGYVSSFNHDAIKQVEVYKSGFPASFGGRASSVIDIETLDGNKSKTEGDFSVGLLCSSLAINGPLSKNVTYNVALRSSYFDIFTLLPRLQYIGNDNGYYVNYRFSDINGKLTYSPSTRRKTSISTYFGKDIADSKDKFSSLQETRETIDQYIISNQCFTINDRYKISQKLIWYSTINYSGYRNKLQKETEYIYGNVSIGEYTNSESAIHEINIKSRLHYYSAHNQKVIGGVEASHYWFAPTTNYSYQTNSVLNASSDTIMAHNNLMQSNEFSLFFEDEISLPQKFNMNIGARGILYNCNNCNYWNLEPRISIRKIITDNISIKSSYSLMHQYNHVILSTFEITEHESWYAATETIPPQLSNQFSGGIFGSIPKINLELSSEVYYKKMKNLLTYNTQNFNSVFSSDIKEIVISGGEGETYGVELEAKHSNDVLKINASYVLSWNYRQFEELNNGNKFPFRYDRRHQLSILFMYKMGKHYSINSNFAFATGRPFTVPTNYIQSNNPTNYKYYAFSGINNCKMPNYHRLDLSLIKRDKTKRGNVQQFSFNIYNAYARQNPISIYLERGKLYQVSIFTIIPSLSYRLEF